MRKRWIRYLKRRIKNFLIITACYFSMLQVILCACSVEGFMGWQPFAYMLANIAFLVLVARANDVL